MCGIAGLIDPALRAEEVGATVARMAQTLVHRGPDDEGFFVADGAGLGMRRLSIIDVRGGHQPMTNEDGSVQAVFNGEIYNYLELREGLLARGHVLHTHADTEVIPHLYEELGVECVRELRGMFALALWDQHRRRLVLARDRIGKKPLFFAQCGERLYFGSEIKALLAADRGLAEPDAEALLPYLRYGFVPEPGTMFRHVRKLRAAHRLVWQAGATTTEPYWQLEFGTAAEPARSATQWADALDALLEECVRIRLMSDVPLGVFLSGGLDSSAVVAYAHRAGLRPLKTFTIGFDQPRWDESADAQVVAEHFQTEHHRIRLRAQDLTAGFSETLLALVRHFDEPFGDSSALPTYHVSKLAREHVTVILSGDGGDELFAGYLSYQGIKLAEYYRRLPAWLASRMLPGAMARLAHWLPPGRRYQALRVLRLMQDSALPFEQMYFSKMGLCTPARLRVVLVPELAARWSERQPPVSPDMLAAMRSDLPAMSKASYADLRFRLLEDMLVKVDRMSMAHSLEVRSPFLDYRLVELAAAMPPELKLRGWEKKAILRDVLRPMLPPGTLRKRKQGFEVPLREWFRHELAEMVHEYLSPSSGRLPGDVFDLEGVSAVVRQHQRGEADHSAVIWLLLSYAAWRDLYIDHG